MPQNHMGRIGISAKWPQPVKWRQQANALIESMFHGWTGGVLRNAVLVTYQAALVQRLSFRWNVGCRVAPAKYALDRSDSQT
jgi:hypothetical protein